MSVFDSLFQASAAPLLASVFGGTATYTPPEGAAVTLAELRFEQKAGQPTPGADGETLQEQATAVLRAAEVAAPVRLATITRNGLTWTVDQVLELPGGDWQLELVRSVPEEKSRESYRLRR